MSDPDRRYHAVDQRSFGESRDARPEFFAEIDIGSFDVVFDDGRPVTVETWFDNDCELLVRTYWYSAVDAEQWTTPQHLAYLSRNGQIKPEAEHRISLGVKMQTDQAGRLVFAISIAMDGHDNE